MRNIVFIIFAIVLTETSTAQSKVCIINNAEIYATLPDTKNAQTEIENYGISLNKVEEDFRNQLNAAIEKFIRDSSTMTAAVIEASRKSLQDQVAQSSKLQSDNRLLIEEKTNQLNQQLNDKVNAAIKKVAVANGFNHIISIDAAILYPKAIEITDKVKAELGIK